MWIWKLWSLYIGIQPGLSFSSQYTDYWGRFSGWQSQDIYLEVFSSSIWYKVPKVNNVLTLDEPCCPWAKLYEMATWSEGSVMKSHGLQWGHFVACGRMRVPWAFNHMANALKNYCLLLFNCHISMILRQFFCSLTSQKSDISGHSWQLTTALTIRLMGCVTAWILRLSHRNVHSIEWSMWLLLFMYHLTTIQMNIKELHREHYVTYH